MRLITFCLIDLSAKILRLIIQFINQGRMLIDYKLILNIIKLIALKLRQHNQTVP